MQAEQEILHLFISYHGGWVGKDNPTSKTCLYWASLCPIEISHGSELQHFSV
jgi:hypothetical protein